MGRPPARARTWTGATLLAVTALAAVFRLHMLDTVPPGLYLDETLNAQHAIAWRLSAHKAWFEGTPPIPGVWADVPNLYLAGVSGVLRLFGDGFLATRMTSVVPSLACVPLLYALARSVTGRRQALLAAGLLAVSHWAARTGRDGTYEVAMTALQLAGLASLGRALARDRLMWSALAGVLLGASIYTYTAARLVLAQAGVWLGWELVASAERRRTLAHAGLCLAVALLCAAPYAVYLATRSAGDLGVLALTGPAAPHGVLGTLAENVAAHLAMFNLRGGTYARDNLPGWPMLDPVTGLLFLAGLLVALRRAVGTTETQLGLWLARHPDERPAYVLYDTVRLLDSSYASLWYPETNGYNWYRPIDSAAAIHLSAGVYRRSPEHALDPAALHGDVDVVARLPGQLPGPAVFVVPPTLVDAVGRFYAIDGREDVTDGLGRGLGTVLRVRPR